METNSSNLPQAKQSVPDHLTIAIYSGDNYMPNLKSRSFKSQLQKSKAHEKANASSSTIKQYDNPRRYAVTNVESKTGQGEGTYLEQGNHNLQWG